MNIRKLAKVLIAVQLGLTASGVTAEPNDKKSTADKSYSPYASSTMPINV